MGKNTCVLFKNMYITGLYFLYVATNDTEYNTCIEDHDTIKESPKFCYKIIMVIKLYCLLFDSGKKGVVKLAWFI